jgi:hypothetical protein
MPSRWNDAIKADVAAAAAQSIITRAGANARLRWCDGPLPSTPGLLTVANRTLSLDVAGTVLGTVVGNAVDVTESTITQTPSQNIDGTPTFVQVETAAGAYVGDVGVGPGSDNWNITGTIRANETKAFSNLRIPIL